LFDYLAAALDWPFSSHAWPKPFKGRLKRGISDLWENLWEGSEKGLAGLVIVPGE
jgi:hypothetical protein